VRDTDSAWYWHDGQNIRPSLITETQPILSKTLATNWSFGSPVGPDDRSWSPPAQHKHNTTADFCQTFYLIGLFLLVLPTFRCYPRYRGTRHADTEGKQRYLTLALERGLVSATLFPFYPRGQTVPAIEEAGWTDLTASMDESGKSRPHRTSNLRTAQPVAGRLTD
jgi:hypothetical protein